MKLGNYMRIKKQCSILFMVIMGVFILVSCNKTGESSFDSAGSKSETKINKNDSKEFVGTWFDSYSERCQMTIDYTEETDNYEIIINWSSSASENTRWTFNGRYDDNEDGIVYRGARIEEIYYDNGSYEEKVIYDDGEGVIYIGRNGKLYWEDHKENTGEDCCFERLDDSGLEVEVDSAQDEVGDFQKDWYRVYTYFQNPDTKETLEIYYYDDGLFGALRQGMSIFDGYNDTYEMQNGGVYVYPAEIGGGQLVYYPLDGNYIEITFAEETTRYYPVSVAEYAEQITPLAKLKSKASESGCTVDIQEEKPLFNGPIYTQFVDDGSYFDEVVLGTWYDESGNPKADWLPQSIGMASFNYGLQKASKVAGEFHFIDGQNFSMDTLKRTSENVDATYAMILTNVNKREVDNGEIILDGYDYISCTPVVIHGDFSQILNGDDLLVFAEYNGLAADDTPNFFGFLFEIINDREIGW